MQLPATATLGEASALAKAAEEAVMQGVLPGAERGVLSIDASALKSFDTSLVAVLLHARRLALGAGRGFEIAGAPDKLAQLASLYGVEALLGLAPSSGPPARPSSPTPA